MTADSGRPIVLVVNGERSWGGLFPAKVQVEQRALQTTSWLLRDGRLHVYDRDGVVRPDLVLWRVGAIRMLPRYRCVVDLIRLSEVPAINAGECIARCFDRLAATAEMRAAGLPVVVPHVAVGDGILRNVGRAAPFVVKVGNHHAGLGKTLVERDDAWSGVADLLVAADDYVASEPWIAHVRDIRCLVLGDRLWAMARESRGWRANVDTCKHTLIDPPPEIAAWTLAARRHLRADLLGLDFLETPQGEYVLLECNDAPGLSGFPDEVRTLLVELALARLGLTG
jgi:ribosomal protein S6--L-glutamate ligase